jgi:hypothetical protein
MEMDEEAILIARKGEDDEAPPFVAEEWLR